MDIIFANQVKFVPFIYAIYGAEYNKFALIILLIKNHTSGGECLPEH